MNPYEGGVVLKHGDKTLTLCFSWGAIATLQAEFGRDTYQLRMAEILRRREIEGLAHLLAAASGQSRDAIMAMNLPLVPVAEALDDALSLALWGPERMPRKDALEDPQKAQRANRLMLSLLPFAQRFMPTFGGPNSGASPRSQPT